MQEQAATQFGLARQTRGRRIWRLVWDEVDMLFEEEEEEEKGEEEEEELKEENPWMSVLKHISRKARLMR